MDNPQILTSYFETDLGEASIAADWSACGRWLAVINADGEVLLFDAQTDTELERWKCHEGGALSLKWHPRLPLFATSSQSGELRIWRIENDLVISKLYEVFLGQRVGREWVELLEWRPNGKQLAVAVGNNVMLLSLEGEARKIPVSRWNSRRHRMALRGFSFRYRRIRRHTHLQCVRPEGQADQSEIKRVSA